MRLFSALIGNKIGVKGNEGALWERYIARQRRSHIMLELNRK